jgi:ABC-2 type transport system ATP-binding protein
MGAAEFVRRASKKAVRVRTPQPGELRAALAGPDVIVTPVVDGAFEVTGLSAEQIGDAAAAAGVALHELTPQQASLEEAFMELTRDDVEFRSDLGEARKELAA